MPPESHGLPEGQSTNATSVKPTSRRKTLSFCLCLVLTAVVTQTCVRIEILNARLGGLLPRELPTTGSPKWRVTAVSARRWAIEGQLRNEESLPYDRPLTDEQEAEIDRRLAPMIPQIENNGKLRTLVGTWGLLQYVLAPLCLAWAVRLVLSMRLPRFRMAAGVFAVCSAISICLMFYRGYFTSLGW